MNQTFTPTSFGVALMPLLLIALLLFCAGWLALGTVYTRYTGLSRWQSAMLWFLSFVVAIIGLAILIPRGMREDGEIIKLIVFVIILSTLSVPFAIRLYRKWIGGHLTEAEKLPGIDGVRAWLGVGNIICAALIPICIWQIFGYSPVAILALTFGLLLAYPLLNMASDSAQPSPAVPPEDLSSEREKVLQLLEAGKISAVESAELLNALGHSAPPPPKPVAEINPQRKMVLLGAALLLIGFFLPWFTINLGEKISSVFYQSALAGNLPQLNSTIRISGGDIGHGLGWWILALGIVAAVLPFFATTLEAALQKKIILAALGIGAILLIYLLSDSIRYASFGILLALAGYALELVGTLKERPAAR
jgi:hypothetical protein